MEIGDRVKVIKNTLENKMLKSLASFISFQQLIRENWCFLV